MNNERKISLPSSATNSSVSLVGLLSFIIALVLLHQYQLGIIYSTIILLLSTAVPMIVLDLMVFKIYQRPTTGIDMTICGDQKLTRVAIKLLGFFGSIVLIFLIYWIFPEYHRDFYIPYWVLVEKVAPFILPVAVLYFIFIDGKMKEPHDGFWYFGNLLIGKWRIVDRNRVRQHLLGWMIKMFFLPLMCAFLTNDVRIFLTFNFGNIFNFSFLFDFVVNLIFMVDLTFVTLGYLLSLRVLDTHVRSAESTCLGWLVALVCYIPFGDFLGRYYFFYQDNFGWKEWLVANEAFAIVWGGAIIFLLAIYTWASVMFGLRFSNLTNRGIITSGPYRWCKHPAYIAKNLSWWLTAVPFLLKDGVATSIRQCLMLAILNYIYYLRAKTEERHLSADPDYIAYCNWIEKNGFFSFIRSLTRRTS